jgi:hypothetical protein
VKKNCTTNLAKYFLIAACSFVAGRGRAVEQEPGSGPPRDFGTLTHSIQVAEVRGGNHEGDGPNKYMLQFSVMGYKKTEDNKVPDDQKTEMYVLLELNSVDLPPVKPLEYLRFVGKSRTPFTQLISGDALREVVSKAMKKLEAKEDQIEVVVRVKLMEQGKIAYFFGNDRLVGQASYYPLANEREQRSLKPKGTFTVADDKGAYSVFEVEYKADGKGDKKP